MARVVMITGGNIGEVEENLERAKQRVEQRVGEIIEESKVYGSEPWGRFRLEKEEEDRAVNAEDREVEEARGGERGKIRERGESGEKDYKVREFLNQVLIVETKLEAIEVLDVIQQIERELGRVREKGDESGRQEDKKGDESVCGVRSEESADEVGAEGISMGSGVEKSISKMVEKRGERGETDERGGRGETAEERCYRSRTMDIDILYYDNIVMESQRLVIPHPMIEKREFVLVPLAELMPNYKDPRTGRTVNQMLKRLLISDYKRE